jgi:hypothetical protein
VDVDLHDPTYDSLDYFFPRLASGGVIVSDDYAWPGCRKAIETFCAEHSAHLSVTAAGHAVVRRIS